MRTITTYQYDLRKIEELFIKAYVPYFLFKKMLQALIDNDLSELNDNVLEARIYATKEQVDTYVRDLVYHNIYKCDTYDKLIAVLANLFTLFTVLIDLRKNITNVSEQPFVIVEDYLKMFGFNIYNVFDQALSKKIVRQIYYYIRRKGTPHLLAILLSLLGFNYFVIAEYWLHKRTNSSKWYLVPEIIHKSVATEMTHIVLPDVEANSRNDALWWLTDEDCDKMFMGDEES